MYRAARLSLLLATSIVTAVHAAPTTPDAIDDTVSTERDERRLPDTLRAADDRGGSRTIDLLIDMQQRSAGLQFNERQRPRANGDINSRVASIAPATAPGVAMPPTRSPRVDAPPTPPSGLFGSGATPMVQSARAATVQPGDASAALSAPARRPGVSSNGEPLPRWLMLPREIVEYVRENRWLVLGSVGGGLLLIWGISSLFARAAANTGRVPGPQPDRAFSADRWGSTRQEARPARRRSHRRPG